jgi:hypothetical protein
VVSAHCLLVEALLAQVDTRAAIALESQASNWFFLAAITLMGQMQSFLFGFVVNSEELLPLRMLCVRHTVPAKIIVLNFRFVPHFATQNSFFALITLYLS